MKKVFITTALFLGICMPASIAQQREKEVKEQREIIIRNNGKDADLRIQFQGDAVTVNGKNISEFKDSAVSIRDRRIVIRDGRGATNELANVFDRLNNFSQTTETKQIYLGIGMAVDNKGVKVETVEKGSPAEKAGLKAGDIITTINDKKMEKPEDVSGRIRDGKQNEEVTIRYLRDGKKNSTKAKLALREVVKNQMVIISPDGRRNEFKMPPMPNMREFNFNFDDNNLRYNFERGRGLNPPAGEKLGIKVSDLETGDGVKVTEVEKNSKADKAGIQPNDVIVEIDGSAVKNINDARMKLNFFMRDSFKIKLMRSGSVKEVVIPKTIRTAEL